MMIMARSIYLSTFNMNGATLTVDDARKWLLHCENGDVDESLSSLSIHDADIIILSLQECPTYPQRTNQEHRNGDNEVATVKNELTFPTCVSVLGPPVIDDNRVKDEIRSVIQKILSDEQHLIADVAMGEPPSSSIGDVIHNEKYYGFIRLLIFAKNDLTKLIAHDKTCMQCPIIPILCPVGRKRSSTYINPATNQRKTYDGSSPDKGAVSIAIPSLQILICSLHLCGTNKYNTMESCFDSIRIDELMKIGQSCREALSWQNISSPCSNQTSPTTNATTSATNTCAHNNYHCPYDNYKKIILGDLNFRVEVGTTEKEKSRGGHDFQCVMNIIESNSIQQLQELFWNHDRLVKLLQSQYNDGIVQLFNRVVDVHMEYFNKCKGGGGNVLDICPTFTFECLPNNALFRGGETTSSLSPQQQKKRIYSDKRTPSWTDRILIDNDLLKRREQKQRIRSTTSTYYDIVWVDTKPHIYMSDHIPLCCYLSLVCE